MLSKIYKGAIIAPSPTQIRLGFYWLFNNQTFSITPIRSTPSVKYIRDEIWLVVGGQVILIISQN